MKTCTKCGIKQDESAYYWRKRDATRCAQCKRCMNADAKRWQTGDGHERKLAYNKRWRETHAERIRTMKTVAQALKRGMLVRPCTCEQCKRDGRIEAAHADYAQPLVVRWLCISCHRTWDSSNAKCA